MVVGGYGRCRVGVPQYHLLALDIDGTLLNSERVVTPRTRAAVLAARAAGMLVVIATGRGPRSASMVVDGLGLGEPLVLVATQGATVWDNGELVLHQPLAAAAARRVVELSLAAGVAALVVPPLHGGETMYLAGSTSSTDRLWDYAQPADRTIRPLLTAATDRLRGYAQRNGGNVRPYDPAALHDDPLAVYMMDDWRRLTAVNERLTGDPAAHDQWRVIFSRTALAHDGRYRGPAPQRLQGAGAGRALPPVRDRARARAGLWRQRERRGDAGVCRLGRGNGQRQPRSARRCGPDHGEQRRGRDCGHAGGARPGAAAPLPNPPPCPRPSEGSRRPPVGTGKLGPLPKYAALDHPVPPSGRGDHRGASLLQQRLHPVEDMAGNRLLGQLR